MNASKAKKEASEKKVFLNQKIAHDKPFLNLFSLKYVMSGKVSRILFRLPLNNNLIGIENGVTYKKSWTLLSGCSQEYKAP